MWTSGKCLINALLLHWWHSYRVMQDRLKVVVAGTLNLEMLYKKDHTIINTRNGDQLPNDNSYLLLTAEFPGEAQLFIIFAALLLIVDADDVVITWLLSIPEGADERAPPCGSCMEFWTRICCCGCCCCWGCDWMLPPVLPAATTAAAFVNRPDASVVCSCCCCACSCWLSVGWDTFTIWLRLLTTAPDAFGTTTADAWLLGAEDTVDEDVMLVWCIAPFSENRMK